MGYKDVQWSSFEAIDMPLFWDSSAIPKCVDSKACGCCLSLSIKEAVWQSLFTALSVWHSADYFTTMKCLQSHGRSFTQNSLAATQKAANICLTN